MKTYYWLNQNRFLSHLRTSVCAIAIVGTSLTLPSAEAGGGPPQSASGGFFPCFTQTSARQVGENLIITFDVTTTATGTFTGSLNGTELDVIHRDGSITLHGTALFTGSFGDRSGTFVFTYTGIGNANTGHETLNFVGRRGTDGLAGIHTQGTAVGDLVPGTPDCPIAGSGTYTGRIVFALR